MAPQFHFKVEGSLVLECAGKCGRKPTYAVLAFKVGDKIETDKVYRIATCGECPLSFGGTPEMPTAQDMAQAVDKGRKLGEAAAGLFVNLYELFREKKE